MHARADCQCPLNHPSFAWLVALLQDCLAGLLSSSGREDRCWVHAREASLPGATAVTLITEPRDVRIRAFC
jgi:hypothetical protein